MKKELVKGILLGSLMTLILSYSLYGFAGGFLKTIQAAENTVKVVVNGKELNAPNYVIDGRTYIQTRDIVEALDKNMLWLPYTSTVLISDKPFQIPSPNPNVKNTNSNLTPQPTVTPKSDNSVQQNYIFRKVNWGMSRGEVIASEGKEPPNGDSEGLAYFNLNIGGLESDIIYNFNENDQLYSIGVMSRETHTNQNDYIYDFNRYVSTLSEKYGKPIINEPIWKNSLFKDSPESYGTAISAGHLNYVADWDLANSKLFCVLRGDNYKITLGFILNSKTIEPRKKESGI